MLTYGLKKGTKNTLLHIDMVHTGSACDCVCPYCQKPLIARKGEIRQHHFAHDKGAECGKARMTALHMLAQNILARDKTVMLPAYKTKYINKLAQQKVFRNIEVEQVCKDESSTRRPDCVCTQGGGKPSLWVEIYCCHKIDENRKRDIIRRKQYCVEIDFSDLLEKDYTERDVKFRLESDCLHREWICCPIWDEENIQKQRETPLKKEKNYSHFILFPNGEATLTPLYGHSLETFRDIEPLSDSMYEAVVSAPSFLDNYYTYEYCYHEAVKAVYKQKDCRTCKYRMYDSLHFNNRDLRIICNYIRDLPSRILPPRYAVTCPKYEFDTQLNNYKADILFQIK